MPLKRRAFTTMLLARIAITSMIAAEHGPGSRSSETGKQTRTEYI
jgi:hypothetical protein